ncbi:NudC domain containing 3 [Phyllostomus discolor]|uniref:NudC domain containing 3 n=1 Tax=Phyllostomus discolor TaxID=89673 RepID=A0A834DNL3_9CHIR|nr:NudC domain containing 3 [Phyllostomus discolor]
MPGLARAVPPGGAVGPGGGASPDCWVSLSKAGEYWWSAVLEGEEQIDIEQINKERSMATVDEEEHAVLDRLTFDYRQKLQGKPQSHELKVHEMLKKGWDAEGSPFRGQRFDPAMFNIPPRLFQSGAGLRRGGLVSGDFPTGSAGPAGPCCPRARH